MCNVSNRKSRSPIAWELSKTKDNDFQTVPREKTHESNLQSVIDSQIFFSGIDQDDTKKVNFISKTIPESNFLYHLPLPSTLLESKKNEIEEIGDFSNITGYSVNNTCAVESSLTMNVSKLLYSRTNISVAGSDSVNFDFVQRGKSEDDFWAPGHQSLLEDNSEIYIERNIEFAKNNAPIVSIHNSDQVVEPSDLNVELLWDPDVERFICPECGTGILHKKDFKRHYKTHIGVKPFARSACGKIFIRRWHLKRHFQIHKGEKPYLCSECWKTFTNARNRNEHCKNQHRKARLC